MYCLAPIEARLTIIEKLFRVTTPPPLEGPAFAQPEPAVVQPERVIPTVSAAYQEAWLRLVERYLKLRAPDFPGRRQSYSILSRESYRWQIMRADLSVYLISLTICFRPRSARHACLRGGFAHRSGGIWYRRVFAL